MTQPEFAHFTSIGINGLPKVNLRTPDGARAEVYLHGGHVTSWAPAGSEERLFVSRASEFGPKAAIRGGVPVIFPQFSGRGPLIKHGFARRMEWELVECGADPKNASRAFATLLLLDNAGTRTVWPHAFQFKLTVAVAGNELSLQTEITNTGAAPFSFTTALHTYLRVDDIQSTSILGLKGKTYQESALGAIQKVQRDAELPFNGEVDRIYSDMPDASVIMRDDEHQVRIQQEGYQDFVIWNPGPKKGPPYLTWNQTGITGLCAWKAGAW